MRHAEIEYWALAIIEAVISGRRVEDARVELKAEWPDPQRAARRLAGHCNAARGEHLLWLIGVDEERGVVGAQPDELSSWWQSTKSHFRGPVPTVALITIYHDRSTVTALYIETEAAPFLINNPAFGNSAGGPVELEVPWREMTITRTARHEDLINLPMPRVQLPELELLDASLNGGRISATGEFEAELGQGFHWLAKISIYVVPNGPSMVVFPAHRLRIGLSFGQGDEINLRYQQVKAGNYGLIADGNIDLVANGPSRFAFEAVSSAHTDEWPAGNADLKIYLWPTGSDTGLLIKCELNQRQRGFWNLGRASISPTIQSRLEDRGSM